MTKLWCKSPLEVHTSLIHARNIVEDAVVVIIEDAVGAKLMSLHLL